MKMKSYGVVRMSIRLGFRRCACSTAAMVGLLFFGGVHADVLQLKGGDRLTGEIDSIAGGRVVLKTEFAGTIGVKLDSVALIESETIFEIRRREGEKLKGQFAVSSHAQEFQLESGAAEALDLEVVASARQNNIGIADLGSDWSNRFDAGISASSGNTSTAAQNYLLESILASGRSEHRILGSFDTQEDEGVKTKEKLQVGYRYKRFFGERWYGLGNLGYYQDKFKGVDSRWTAGGGAGYQFWDNSMGALSSDLGLSYVTEDLEGVTENNPAIRWGVEYNRFFLSKKAEYFYLQNILFIPTNNRGTIYTGSTGLRFSLTEMLTANLRVDLAYET
ncbi:MAG: YdiY family protein, partial [Pseudomonadales bacterium]